LRLLKPIFVSSVASQRVAGSVIGDVTADGERISDGC
jgi:hypothetical protein